jgi:aryl-alcohol dehydrogenase-like predicted oxidoreductase
MMHPLVEMLFAITTELDRHRHSREDLLVPASSRLHAVEIGLGTSAWGDTRAWRYGRTYAETDLAATLDAALAARITFFDTADLYGFGHAETLLGRFVAERAASVSIATKFFPWPWRITDSQLRTALGASLARLRVPKVALYQIHWPLPPRSPVSWMEPLAAAVADGLVDEIGVSNYDAVQMRRSADFLRARGIGLASNQVEYSLLDRRVEFNGIAETCRELGVRLMAYRPLASGLLSGKYTPNAPPPGVRRLRYRAPLLSQLPPLIALLEEIGRANGNRTTNQVALNWLICRGALPIPGAVNAAQALENAGAAGWRLRPQDVQALDEASLAFTRRQDSAER